MPRRVSVEDLHAIEQMQLRRRVDGVGASEIRFPHGVLQITPSRSISSQVQSVLRLGPFSGARRAQIVAPGSTKASMRPGLMQCAFTSPFSPSWTSMPSKHQMRREPVRAPHEVALRQRALERHYYWFRQSHRADSREGRDAAEGLARQPGDCPRRLASRRGQVAGVTEQMVLAPMRRRRRC